MAAIVAVAEVDYLKPISKGGDFSLVVVDCECSITGFRVFDGAGAGVGEVGPLQTRVFMSIVSALGLINLWSMLQGAGTEP